MPGKSLRAVSADERAPTPLTLLEAVEVGSVIDMLLAQRRLIAEALTSAAENTRPQFNNELNKLHVLIAAEQERLAAAAREEVSHNVVSSDEAFDASAV